MAYEGTAANGTAWEANPPGGAATAHYKQNRGPEWFRPAALSLQVGQQA
jgi:hypothetical protein